MNKQSYPYRDFARVRQVVLSSLHQADEPYVLVTGETGTGKTALLRDLRGDLDRARYRIFYFQEAKRLGAPGIVRVLARSLRADTSLYHAVALDRVVHALREETQRVLLWFDEAHDLQPDAIAAARALVESDLDAGPRVQVLLVGMPSLRSNLQALPHLWRRIGVREELHGLQVDEVTTFLDHHFGTSAQKRLCDRSMATLFEHGKGAPGLILPLAKRVFSTITGKAKIEPEQVEDILQRWNLA
jgi:type II secretory pathway predicted ATPase ExeA